MHKINKVFIALLMTWLVYPAMCMAYEDDLLVISYFPKEGVYDKSTLTQLVGKTEKLWTIKDQDGQSVFKNIDSLATENIIVAQQDSVRFRRLIENRELTKSGLSTLKKLVNTHPLLHDRLADASGEQLHIWMRVNKALSDKEKSIVVQSALTILDENNYCEAKDKGTLANTHYQEWQLTADKRKPISAIYQTLKATTNNIKQQAITAYSATDLINYLKQSMSQEDVNATDSAEIEQLYMIAESVRSRHLHDLANPDFSRLKLVRLGDSKNTDASMDGFDSRLIRQWQASTFNYKTLDCRKPS